MGEHTAGESVVVFSSSTLRRVDDSSSTVGVSRYLKGVTMGRSLDSVDSTEVSFSAVGLKPWAPVHAEISVDTSSLDLTISWTRRTRYACRFASSAGINVPLGETAEAYEVDILDASGTVLRTLSATAASITYTAEQQTADFAGSVTEVNVAIYQISSVVGRGYGLTATLTAHIPSASSDDTSSTDDSSTDTTSST